MIFLQCSRKPNKICKIKEDPYKTQNILENPGNWKIPQILQNVKHFLKNKTHFINEVVRSQWLKNGAKSINLAASGVKNSSKNVSWDKESGTRRVKAIIAVRAEIRGR